ncbi:MAG TPA: MerR family transcriptional regulator [Micromonosporaceae bacterium]
MTEPGLTAGEAARRLGVAVTTLRTWHQRYGLGPTDYTPGQHRRYTPRDMALLTAMHALTSEGVPASQAARVALAGPGAPPPDGDARAGGGNAIPVGRGRAAARGLAAAAMRLDARAMTDVLTAAVDDLGVVDAWDQLIRPVLSGIARRQAGTTRLVDVEHLLSRSVTATLAAVTAARQLGPPRVLLACGDEEQHSMALEALAAALAEAGVASRLLGARVPSEVLMRAIARTGPLVVVIWSQTSDTAAPRQLEDCLAVRPRPVAIMAAGPGWDGATVPPGITCPASLTEALRSALSAVGHDG